jgi:predicted RNA-binding Zn-ribbon protein involved in translation (DUF1610 family)
MMFDCLCPNCGEVRIHASRVSLALETTSRTGSWSWSCPECGGVAHGSCNDANPEWVELVVASARAGCTNVYRYQGGWTRPPANYPPPITEVECVAFGVRIADCGDVIAKLEATR